MALSKNLKELQVLGSKHDTIRKGLVYELLSAQDKVLCSTPARCLLTEANTTLLDSTVA